MDLPSQLAETQRELRLAAEMGASVVTQLEEKTKLLYEVQKENENLKKLLISEQMKTKSLRREKTELQQSALRTMDSLSEVQNQNSMLSERITALNEESRLQKEKNTEILLREKINSLRERNSALESRISELVEVQTQASLEKKTLQSELNALIDSQKLSSDEIHSAFRTIEQYENKLNDYENKIDYLKEVSKFLREENEQQNEILRNEEDDDEVDPIVEDNAYVEHCIPVEKAASRPGILSFMTSLSSLSIMNENLASQRPEDMSPTSLRKTQMLLQKAMSSSSVPAVYSFSKSSKMILEDAEELVKHVQEELQHMEAIVKDITKFRYFG